MEKNLSKTTTAKLYPAKKWEAMHKKNIYSIADLQGLFNVCKNWTFTFKIGLPN